MRPALLWIGIVLALSLSPSAADDPPTHGRRADQEALASYAGLVGDWRGTGQVRRGSARGAWTESATWVWSLDPDSAALSATIEDGKALRSVRLEPSGEPGAFRLAATLADGTERTFEGRAGERAKLVLEANDPPAGSLARITLTPLHETRFLMLLETAAEREGGPLSRLGEVGYTRQGVAFAAGDGHPACIVTGGRGTTKVMHDGKEYWVCCSGCKTLFEDDPESVLAEAAERAGPRD